MDSEAGGKESGRAAGWPPHSVHRTNPPTYVFFTLFFAFRAIETGTGISMRNKAVE